MQAYSLGIDIGGTFTDAVLAEPGGIVAVAKHLTTAEDPATAAITAALAVLEKAAVPAGSVVRVVHGTTLATNTILEGRGGPIALVTTRGFSDLLTLGRHARVEEDRYDPAFALPPPPVDRSLTFGITERVGARGEVIQPLAESEVLSVARQLQGTAVVGVAVCLLHAYANPAHEQRIAAVLAQHVSVPIVTSSAIWPEVREYDRMTTTVMSAIVGPVMADYLHDLEDGLRGVGINGPLYVMESAGGVMSARQATRRAIATVESGPAAGVIAAKTSGAQTAHHDVIAFDMGGTTAKAAVIQGGEPGISHEFQVGGRGSFGSRRSGTGVPIQIPAIDLAEVGAGGGSVAWVDPQGTLHVGPRSAGASPGPACYGRGGNEPTVTDANVILGYLDLRRTAMDIGTFDPALSHQAMGTKVAARLGAGTQAAAAAVYDIANAMMVGAIHVVTVQRGIDPRRYALVTSGGAGPLHAAEMAALCGIGTVLVPPACGVASAVGLLTSDLRTDLIRSVQVGEGDFDRRLLEGVFQELEAEGASTLTEGRPDELVVLERSIDVRYRRQAHNLTLAVGGQPLDEDVLSELKGRFYALHETKFGVGRPGPIELVNLRVRATMRVDPVSFRRLAQHSGGEGTVPSHFVETAVIDRAACPPSFAVRGPALLEEPEATIRVPDGWRATILVDGSVELLTDGPVGTLRT
jgi:N-methylhydantoinase A